MNKGVVRSRECSELIMRIPVYHQYLMIFLLSAVVLAAVSRYSPLWERKSNNKIHVSPIAQENNGDEWPDTPDYLDRGATVTITDSGWQVAESPTYGGGESFSGGCSAAQSIIFEGVDEASKDQTLSYNENTNSLDCNGHPCGSIEEVKSILKYTMKSTRTTTE